MKKHYIFLRRFSEWPVWGGCENRVLDYFSEIDYKKTTITLLTNHDLFSHRFKEHKIPARVQLFPFDLRPSMGHFWEMLTLLRSCRPTHVVIIQGAFTDFSLADFAAAWIASWGRLFALEVQGAPGPPQKCSKKYLGVFPGTGLWWYCYMIQMSLRGWLCKRILAVSDEVKQRMVDLYHYPASRILSVFHGIDTGRFMSDPSLKKRLRSQFGFSNEDVLFISTARLSPEKQIGRLIRAFDSVFFEQKNIVLLVLGTGLLEGDLKDLAKACPCAERIKFLGFQKDIADCLKMSDVFILPSDIEGLGIALLEAMATELVCIATRTPGPNEILSDGDNGFLVERTEEGIRAGMIRALRLSHGERQAMTQRARTLINDRFQRDKRVAYALGILGINTENATC